MINDLEKKEQSSKKPPNLINKKIKKKKNHPALRYWGKIVLVLTIALLAVGLSLSFKIISSVSSHSSGADGEKISVFQQIGNLLSKQGEKLKGEENNRVNILLMGMGGYGHQGSLLTDTIILASFKPSTKQIALLSIPRDLAVEYPGDYYWRKINNSLAFGRDMDYPGGGEALAGDLVKQVTGQKIHYYGLIDFTGFEQIIDGLGGVKINVETSFNDYSYPTSDYGYQTISFSAGEQLMDGETALKFVRSRHGTNGEGSDFARAERQQKVIIALKNKITSFSTLISPKKIAEILNTLGSHTKTDMEIWEMLRLYKLTQSTKAENFNSIVLDNAADGLLKTETGINGAYILVPKADNFSQIHEFCENIFQKKESPEENPKVSIKK